MEKEPQSTSLDPRKAAEYATNLETMLEPVIEGLLLLYSAKVDPIKAVTDRDYYESMTEAQMGRIKRITLHRTGDLSAIDFVDDVTILEKIGMISAARQIAARKENKEKKRGIPLDVRRGNIINSHGTKPMGRSS